MTDHVVSGTTSTGVVLNKGDTMEVTGGGIAISTIDNAGTISVGFGGTTSNSVINSGGTETVTFGGSVSSTTVSSGGTEILNGGSSYGTIVASGGKQTVSGSTASGTVVSSGGSEVVLSGGTTQNTVVSSGGTQVISSGGNSEFATIQGGGSEVVSAGGQTNFTTLTVSGTEVVSSGGSAYATTVSSGAVLTVSSGGSSSDTYITGGRLTLLSGSTAIDAIDFVSGTSGTLSVTSSFTSAVTISGFAAGDAIIISDQAYASSDQLTVSGSTATVTAGGATYTLTIQNASTDHLTLASTSGGRLEIVSATCFLPGTRIAVPGGESAIECLHAGDAVSVLVDGVWVERTITWIGRGTMDVDASSDPRAVCPVRIRADAFAPGVPVRDLLVTPEHCVFHVGVLIPARMLVNNQSIVIDETIRRYDYMHVELAEHGILLSDGLTTESYLDTGNRNAFASAGAGATTMEARSVAPLAVDRETVEPLWRQLVERAQAMLPAGPSSVAPPAMTDDPDLRLLLEDGSELAPRWHEAMRFLFQIPKGVRVRRLLSRAAVPAEVHGPFLDDRRRLGVAVEQVLIWNGLEPIHVDTSALGITEGWHGAEGRSRWTNGSAALELPEAANQDSFVELTLAATMRYPQAS